MRKKLRNKELPPIKSMVGPNHEQPHKTSDVGDFKKDLWGGGLAKNELL